MADRKENLKCYLGVKGLREKIKSQNSISQGWEDRIVNTGSLLTHQCK